jgi:hypothetical protein
VVNITDPSGRILEFLDRILAYENKNGFGQNVTKFLLISP